MSKLILIILAFALVLSGCRKPAPPRPALTVRSPEIAQNGSFPKEFTCDGYNFSPQVSWEVVPPGTQTWALILEDPDAPGGTFSHWVAANIPVGTQNLTERQTASPVMPEGGTQGLNDFGNVGYGGPCPPKGTHHYVFRVFAVDTVLTLPTAFDRRRLLEALKDHTLGEGMLTGTYTR